MLFGITITVNSYQKTNSSCVFSSVERGTIAVFSITISKLNRTCALVGDGQFIVMRRRHTDIIRYFIRSKFILHFFDFGKTLRNAR